MRTFLVGKDGAMPSKYDQETRAKAIRLFRDHAGDYDSPWAAMCAISGRLGMNAETLRKWVRQAEVDEGQSPGFAVMHLRPTFARLIPYEHIDEAFIEFLGLKAVFDFEVKYKDQIMMFAPKIQAPPKSTSK